MGEKKVNTDLKVLTTKDVRKAFVMNQSFVPSFAGSLFIRKGYLKVRYKFNEHLVEECNVLFLNRLVVIEFLEISADAELMMIVIENGFQHRVPIRFSKLDMIQYFATSPFLQLSFNENEFEEIWQVLEIMENRQHQQDYQFTVDLLHTLLVSVSYMMAKQIGENAAVKSQVESRSEKLAVEFIHLLHIHFREQHNLRFYAQRLGVTSKHLSENLKKVTGFTGRELINMALICEAKMLLVNDNLKVGVISEQLNFSDQFSFSKFFKRLTSSSPTEYGSGFVSV